MSPAAGSTPLLGFAAFSGTGKTTLLKNLLPRLAERGVRVAVIKHAHHSFDVDRPGKDSYELRKAGARRMLVASRNLRALMEETPDGPEPRLADLLARLPRDGIDLVLVEGFKHERFPKIELHRPSLGRPLLFPDDDSIIAVATDDDLPAETTLPVLALNDPAAVAEFVVRFATDR